MIRKPITNFRGPHMEKVPNSKNDLNWDAYTFGGTIVEEIDYMTSG